MRILLVALLPIVFNWFVPSTGLTISRKKVICVIDQTTSAEQLMRFKNELWQKKKIQLDIEQVTRNQDNLITQLKISVNCNDGFKGSAQADFKDVDTKLSFYRIYKKNVASPFGIGRGVLPETK